ncbi:major pilin protein fimA [Klebsiella michiganensis]|uniref:Major pilin protein fimA n=1 Tax=Klebsiella michiganensis TaxID=1134687 RepID=A0A7H4LTV3_9ENTR|nr:major pilin protein fimA [Klebsiella michiganensis]
MTLSISALCPESGQLGIAISSSSIAVGARCPWLLAGVGAVSSQNITLPALGPQILAGLEAGLTPQQALTQALGEDRFSDYRQVAVIDASGESAVFSGEHTLGIWQLAQGENCVAAGNMLANPQVITAMTAAFEAASGELASRLIAALQAGIDAGGEAGRSTRRRLKSWRITPGQWWIYASTGRKNAR